MPACHLTHVRASQPRAVAMVPHPCQHVNQAYSLI